MKSKCPNVVSIAGVDPSGGAGILADIKTISAQNAYACGVVTALTAQNTVGVTAVFPIPVDMVAKQIDTLFEDVAIDSVKIGMLFDSQLIKTVAEGLEKWNPRYIVLDPVMVAKSGDPLLQQEAIAALREYLLPISTVITPNLPEAQILLGWKGEIDSDEKMEEACRLLWKLKGSHGYVFLKGGHRENTKTAEDFLFDGKKFTKFSSKRIATKNTHGTGCALSSAIAALLPQTKTVKTAMKKAKKFMDKAIAGSDDLEVGHGHGPIKHFYKYWK